MNVTLVGQRGTAVLSVMDEFFYIFFLLLGFLLQRGSHRFISCSRKINGLRKLPFGHCFCVLCVVVFFFFFFLLQNQAIK